MLRPDQLDVDRACVLVIDLQVKLLPFIGHRERVLAAGRKLLDGVRPFGLPVLASEQYAKGLGSTDQAIQDALDASGAPTLDKLTMSACGEDSIRKALDETDRPQIVLIGIEAHVCVQQTALDLRAMDYDVFVCADAVGSRGRMDYETSLARMRQAGVLVTTVESALFELCSRCDTQQFKEMIEVVKATPPADE
ncbi:MAG: isochorismatase family protein [Phycisphaerales bacterium]|nr:MAG: isochorismatase family protein [Phycisphaerales bacterium]